VVGVGEVVEMAPVLGFVLTLAFTMAVPVAEVADRV